MLIVLVRQRELHDAYELAETLRATISIGVTAHQSGDTIDAMLARVDQALYRAKREGRNCVRVANEHDVWAELVAAQ